MENSQYIQMFEDVRRKELEVKFYAIVVRNYANGKEWMYSGFCYCLEDAFENAKKVAIQNIPNFGDTPPAAWSPVLYHIRSMEDLRNEAMCAKLVPQVAPASENATTTAPTIVEQKKDGWVV